MIDPVIILDLEKKGLVTRTFRRLDPERQIAVVNAILEEAIAKGPTNINVKDVASRADVSVGSLYQYFNARQGLLDFTIELVVVNVSRQFAEARPYLAEMSLREALSTYIRFGLEWSQENITIARFFSRAAYSGDENLAKRVVRPIATAMRELITEALIQAARRGEIRQDIDLEASSRVINALMIAVADPILLPYLNVYFQVIGDTTTPERAIDSAIEIALRGISANS